MNITHYLGRDCGGITVPIVHQSLEFDLLSPAIERTLDERNIP